MEQNGTIIVQFRRDLRLRDNPALLAAHKTGLPIIAVFILDEENSGVRYGAAAKWWLHHSLIALNKSLDGKLTLFNGDSFGILSRIIKDTGAVAIYRNRVFEPESLKFDAKLKKDFSDLRI